MMQKSRGIVKSPKQFFVLLFSTIFLRKAVEKYRFHTIRMNEPSTGLERYEMRKAKREAIRRREESQFIRVSQIEET